MKEIPCNDKATWLEQRRGLGIGASEAAVIMGVSRFKSPFQLWHEKLGLDAESDKDKEAREWGLLLEAPIATRFAQDADPKRIIIAPPPYTIFQSDDHPYMIATLDRLQRHPQYPDPLPLELKTAHWNLKGDWQSEPPLEYMVQVQHQLAVTNAPMGSVAALVGGMEFLWCDIERDEQFIALLTEQERRFWHSLIEHKEPPIDASQQTKATLAKLYARDTGEIVALPVEAIEWDNALAKVKADLETLGEKKDFYENQIRAALRDATAGELPNGVIYTYKRQETHGYVVAPKAFRVLRRKGTPR